MLVVLFLCQYAICFGIFFFFKQKTAYEMRISDWSSDVCSSDLLAGPEHVEQVHFVQALPLLLGVALEGAVHAEVVAEAVHEDVDVLEGLDGGVVEGDRKSVV